MPKKKTEEPTFEASLKQLEQAVEKLEAGNLPLSEALTLFEEGLKASNACRALLENARQRVQVLVAEHGGQFELTDLDGDAEEMDV